MIECLRVEASRTLHDIDALEGHRRTLDGQFRSMMH